MAEHRDASLLVMHCCKNEKHTRKSVHGTHKFHKVKQKDMSSGDAQQKTQRAQEDTLKQPLVVFEALVPSDLQNHCLYLQNLHTHAHKYTHTLTHT